MTEKKDIKIKKDDAKITLGRNSNGSIEEVSLGDLKHLLVGGVSGAGKSSLFQRIARDLTDQGVEVYLLDPKRVGYISLKGKEHFHLFTSMEKVVPLLQKIIEQLEIRYQVMEKNNTDKCDAGRIVFMVDEAADLFMSIGKNEREQLRRILSLGRQCGIYIIMGTQVPSRRIFGGAIVDLFPSRLALKCSTTNASRVILDMAGAENLPLYSGIWMNPKGFKTTINLLPPINNSKEDDFNKISNVLEGLVED